MRFVYRPKHSITWNQKDGSSVIIEKIYRKMVKVMAKVLLKYIVIAQSVNINIDLYWWMNIRSRVLSSLKDCCACSCWDYKKKKKHSHIHKQVWPLLKYWRVFTQPMTRTADLTTIKVTCPNLFSLPLSKHSLYIPQDSKQPAKFHSVGQVLQIVSNNTQ